MPSKLQFYTEMADHVAGCLTGSFQDWTAFLTTAARLYKYPFDEQLMIYAQRPEATACAEYDLWNDQMRRYVRRGSKGIALIDASGDRPRLRYVFDVSDTGGRENSRRPYLWRLGQEHEAAVSDALERQFGVSGEQGLADQLEQIASRLAMEYWEDNQRDILAIVDGSYLEGYDDFNVGAAFRNAAAVSITYSLLSRCGLEPENYFEHEDFLSIFDWNTPDAVYTLGTAVSQLSERALRQIEVTIKNYEREKDAERSKNDERADLHAERGLSDPRPDLDRAGGGPAGQVREDAENVSEGASPGAVEPIAPDREAVPPSAGDRRDGAQPSGADDAGAGAGGGRDGGAESQRPDDVGGADEQLQSPGEGDHFERAGVQLTSETPEPVSEAAPPAAQPVDLQPVQLSLFPTEAEQIAYIAEAESVQTPSAFSIFIPQEDIDHILRLEGNTDNARMMIAAEFSKGKTAEELGAYLQKTFHGGNGIVTAGGRYSAWYAEDGIHIATGDAARYLTSAKVVSWTEAAERIGQLLEGGEYATNVELAEAPGYERKRLAERLWELLHDFSDEADSLGFFPSIENFRGNNFPSETEALANALTDPAKQAAIAAECRDFLAAYAQNRELLRFHYHKRDELLTGLAELPLPRREYSTEMAELPAVGRFITEDEIGATLSRGSNVEGGKGRIYAYFTENHTQKEQAAFLKEEYGWSGSSSAVSGTGWLDTFGKGIRLRKDDCPEVQINWNQAAKRVSELIRKDRFLSPKEKERFAQLQERYAGVGGLPTPSPRYGFPEPERIAQHLIAVNDYNSLKEQHPNNIVLYQVGDFFEMYGEDAKTAAGLLDLNLATRNIPNVGRVPMCGIPAHQLEQNAEKLRETHDVTISAVDKQGQERRVFTVVSIDDEPEQAIDAPEAEPSAPDVQAELARYKPIVREAIEQDAPYRNACGHSDRENAVIEGNAAMRRAILGSGDMELIKLFSDVPEFRDRLCREVIDETYPRLHEMLRPLSQDDIDNALRAWNGDMDSKRAVVRYMEAHGREKDTAAWLAREYGGRESKSLFFTRSGSPESLEMPWPKVQRRLAQLIQADDFFTDQERDNFEDIDPVVIREELAQRGIVNGQVVDEAAANNSPFIQRVMADVERIAQREMAMDAPDRYSIRLLPYEGGIMGIWDAAIQKYYGEGGQLLRFAEQENAIDYLANLQSIQGIPQEVIFTTANGSAYRPGDTLLASFDENSEVRMVIDHVDEDDIWYTMPSAPEQKAVSMDRTLFEKYLDKGNIAVIAPEPPITVHEVDAQQIADGQTIGAEPEYPYEVGDIFLLEDGTPYAISRIEGDTITLRDTSIKLPRLPHYREVTRDELRRLAEEYSEGGRPVPRYSVTMTSDAFADPEDAFAIWDILSNDYYLRDGMSVATFSTEQEAEAFLRKIQPEESAPEQAADTPAIQRDPLAPAYKVGDTVYLDDKPFEITEVGNFDVQLRDPSLYYPIFRAESKERLSQLLRQDPRNAAITDYLPAELDIADADLQDALVGDGGLLELRDKETVSGWLRAGEGNARIAQRLAETYAGTVETMTLLSGEEADYRATATGFEVEIEDKFYTHLSFTWNEVAPILRAMYQQERDGFFHAPAQAEPPQPEAAAPQAEPQPSYTTETVAFYPGEKNNLPFDVEIRTLRTTEPEHDPPQQTDTLPAVEDTIDDTEDIDELLDRHPISIQVNGEWQTFPNAAAAEEAAYEEYKANLRKNAQNFRITDDDLGVGGPKTKYQANIAAIKLLKYLEETGLQASPEQQAVLSRYVGWGGVADAFDPDKENWSAEYAELKELLTPEEYAAARSSTLNAHYTSPTVIKAIYEAVGKMGFETGNILEPSMGVGNFFGLLPEEMQNSKLYGVELDSITGRIAQQLYPKADITVAGFETTDRKDFFDLAIGNVPFGQYQVNDRPYDKLGFSIHDYFFAKTLDQVRPGGVVAFVTSRYTMDKQSPEVRKYIAQRAELLGAIRLPNNAFKANAGTDVVSDIIFLQKRDRPIDIEPDWVHLGQNEDGFAINSYFTEHPEMILGRQTSESTQYGKQDFTVAPIEGLELADQLHDAVKYIRGTYREAELPDLGEGEAIRETIPADPNVKNHSYTVVDGEVYFRENSIMTKPDLNATAAERVKGMVELRECVQKLIGQQMDGFISDDTIRQTQAELNRLYDKFTSKYGLINNRGNALAFADDSSYYLLCSLEVLDEDKNLKRKADMFTKRTIKPHEVVTSVDTASEALALSIAEKARVDMAYMSGLTGKDEDTLARELRGVIYKDFNRRPDGSYTWRTADDFLSGNVREKLDYYTKALEYTEGTDSYEAIRDNVEALKKAQPKDLDASEIEVRLGATWVGKEYIQQFMEEVLDPPYYTRRNIRVNFAEFTGEWNITGKNAVPYNDINAYMTYGTERANAYKILEDTLNLRDVRVYDTIHDADGTERRVLNSKETTLAQQKQQALKDAFKDWIWRDPDRRHELVTKYNLLFNSTRPREYDGSHITFSGINPEIKLREHQLNAVAHILYGGNTLLAHEVGAGKTFEMVAAAMESKRLGLCQKSLFAVPNHLTEQWASEFLRLYPSANILVATKKDFEPRNRKKFCARIATGDYDAVIIGHSQFERIPISVERQERLLNEQIWEVEEGLRELKAAHAERFTIKQLERTKKSLEARLKKLSADHRKDDVVTFEQLGVDRLYVDEAHSFKNLFLYTKMRNVAGLSTTDAQKSSDMLLKCRYLDEITDSRGVVFATGTPVSNSMTELYTMQRYLQHDTLRRYGLTHFDSWASTFGETTTAIELAPEGTGYRARTRFAKFFNLPELMTLFKEVADIKTADQLNLPRPTATYHNVVAHPTEIQKEMVQQLSERAAEVHAGRVEPTKDNMLKITSDGRKLGLDQRVINPDLPDDPSSKVNQCVDNILRIWRDGQADKLTQLVFSDLSTPKTTSAAKVAKAPAGILDSPELHALEQLTEAPEEAAPFTIYEDIREKLVAGGIPREQVAFIHEANTDARKKELFAKVRSGQVRVLMGSTFKMGAGMNVQDRLIALHDLDCPWRPGDLEQRSGRIIRQGNMNPEVHIYRYVTEGTFDSYLWQTVENKQKFISQIMTSKSPVRSCEDIDETALSYAEIKALCAGDDRIREKMDLDVDVSRLRLMKANHQSQQYRLEDNILKVFPKQIEENKGFIAGFEADMATLAQHPHPADGFAGMEIKGDKLTDKDNAGAAIVEAFKDAKGMEPVPIGSYRGFAMSLTVENFGQEFVLTLKGQMSHRVKLGKDPRGNLTRIDNALNGMEERLRGVQAKLDNIHEQMKLAQSELGKPFPQEEELRVKSARLAELNAELNIDDKTPMERLAGDTVAKTARPSVLGKLKTPPVHGSGEKKKSHRMEER